MNGVLGTFNLLANVRQAVYYNSYETASVVILNLCNKGNTTAEIRVAICNSSTSVDDKEWIVYDEQVGPRSTYEKMSIMVGIGKYLVVRSTSGDVNAVVYGVTGGTTAPTGIPINTGGSPTWVTSATLPTIYAADAATSIQLVATDSEGEPITYAVTGGSLPTGLSLSTSGLITGTPTSTGYTPGIADATSTTTITATDSRGNSTARTFTFTKSWADGTSSGKAIPASVSVTAVVGYTGQASNTDIWVKDRSGNNVQTKLFKNGSQCYILIAGISDDTTHTSYASYVPTGAWFGRWTNTETFGSYTTANQAGGYKSSLYHNYYYDDILVMQGFSNASISSDYYANSNEVAFTNNGFLGTTGVGVTGARNLRNFFSAMMVGSDGIISSTNGITPNLTTNGAQGRYKAPVTFLKGSAATSRSRYKNGSTQGEMSATNVIDFGNQNCEGYRYAMCNALGCEATGCNIEHQSWTADITNNYSVRNFSEPNWDANWGITGVSWLYWLIWAKS